MGKYRALLLAVATLGCQIDTRFGKMSQERYRQGASFTGSYMDMASLAGSNLFRFEYDKHRGVINNYVKCLQYGDHLDWLATLTDANEALYANFNVKRYESGDFEEITVLYNKACKGKEEADYHVVYRVQDFRAGAAQDNVYLAALDSLLRGTPDAKITEISIPGKLRAHSFQSTVHISSLRETVSVTYTLGQAGDRLVLVASRLPVPENYHDKIPAIILGAAQAFESNGKKFLYATRVKGKCDDMKGTAYQQCRDTERQQYAAEMEKRRQAEQHQRWLDGLGVPKGDYGGGKGSCQTFYGNQKDGVQTNTTYCK